jgi:hypothetical protein
LALERQIQLEQRVNIEAPPIPVEVSDHALPAMVAVEAQEKDKQIVVIIYIVVH